jgi:hypothetical protein
MNGIDADGRDGLGNEFVAWTLLAGVVVKKFNHR